MLHIHIGTKSIQEQAIYTELRNSSKQLIMNIIRFMLYPNSQQAGKWKYNIYSALNDIEKLDKHDVYPDPKFIKKAISARNCNISGYIRQVTQLIGEDPRNISLYTINRVINNYQNWIAAQLSMNGVVDIREVDSKLTKLCSNLI